jgi:hypothetical protein
MVRMAMVAALMDVRVAEFTLPDLLRTQLFRYRLFETPAARYLRIYFERSYLDRLPAFLEFNFRK